MQVVFLFKDKEKGKILLNGNSSSGLYHLQPGKFSSESPLLASISTIRNNNSLWHDRLCHAHNKIVSKVAKNCNFDNLYCCEVCSILHLDVWGPAPITSIPGFRY